MPESPIPMTVAEFYDAHVGSRDWICGLPRPSGWVWVKVIGAVLAGEFVHIADKHGRTFRLGLGESVAVIAR
jgi:hypothetical protein